MGLVRLLVRLDPTLVGRGGQCWCRKQCLATDMPALVHGWSDMLREGRTCWWYQLDVIVLHSKQLAACLDDIL